MSPWPSELSILFVVLEAGVAERLVEEDATALLVAEGFRVLLMLLLLICSSSVCSPSASSPSWLCQRTSGELKPTPSSGPPPLTLLVL